MATSENNKWTIGILILLLTVYSGLFFVRPINLATADLGRHMVNGELVLNGVYDVLFANHYSFTEPDHAFLNHHWGSGVLFYLCHAAFGFKGLSVLYMILNLLAITLMVLAMRMKANTSIVLLSALSMIPLLSYRVEVRPEGFSYALIAGYYYLFTAFSSGRIRFNRFIVVILFLQLLWVNLHIFFFLGIMLSVVFLVYSLFVQKEKTVQLAITSLGLVLVSLINPNLLQGLLAPLTIFKEYGYMVAENQSVWFMIKRFGNPQLYHLLIFGPLTVVFIVISVARKNWKKMFIEAVLALVFLTISCLAVRGIPLFALFFAPLLAVMMQNYVENLDFEPRKSFIRTLPYFGILFLTIFIPLRGTYYSARNGNVSLGLYPNIDKCGAFLQSQHLPGRIFNNYDFGSYLIYYLHQQQKVFVDNRPEAYSVAFFDSIYRPMQQNDSIWKIKSEEFGINVICFYRLDNTPWGQPFLIDRTQDDDWVPIFVDDVSLVLIRNKASNQQWIDKFALPRSMFSGVPNS